MSSCSIIDYRYNCYLFVRGMTTFDGNLLRVPKFYVVENSANYIRTTHLIIQWNLSYLDPTYPDSRLTEPQK